MTKKTKSTYEKLMESMSAKEKKSTKKSLKILSFPSLF